MTRPDKTLEKVLRGTSDANVRFEELRQLARALGFEERIRGDHHIYTMDGVMEILNFQPRQDAKAKPYQVRQLRHIVTRYRLELRK